MRWTTALRQSASSSNRWRYVPSPTRFGRFPVLEPWMSMTEYPDIRPVPENIARPPYVPSNFFTDGWGDHIPGSDIKLEERLGKEGEDGVRRAGKVVAELLRQVGKLIRVCAP